MKYTLHITRHAERDIRSAADYIEFELYDRNASDELLEEVQNKVSDLINSPMLYQLVEDPVLNSWGIRRFGVKNYNVFYVIQDEMIYVVRFLHQRRDWISLLKTEGISRD